MRRRANSGTKNQYTTSVTNSPSTMASLQAHKRVSSENTSPRTIVPHRHDDQPYSEGGMNRKPERGEIAAIEPTIESWSMP